MFVDGLFKVYCMLMRCDICNASSSVVCEIKTTYLVTYLLSVCV